MLFASAPAAFLEASMNCYLLTVVIFQSERGRTKLEMEEKDRERLNFCTHLCSVVSLTIPTVSMPNIIANQEYQHDTLYILPVQ